ncbi:hypothetical protein JCM10908_004173 [Rhodotorula pacifica]|uniref:uncharacterized protein n=1 Tax=Rhodotorula pacifica TaxID=1495444 RepID=UPI00316C8D9B
MSYAVRNPFTLADKDRLAKYLASFPASERTKLKTFQQAGNKLPGHPAQSWHEHYRKVAKPDIDRRIERIKRERDKAWEAKQQQRRQEAGLEEQLHQDDAEEEEVDQLESDVEVVPRAQPVASTSRNRLSDPPPNSTDRKKRKRTSTGSVRRRSAPSSDDDDDDKDSSSSSDSDAPGTRRRKRPTGRNEFTEDDFDLAVMMMFDRERQGYDKKTMYAKLEEECPEHTIYSWQTWMARNGDDLEDALQEYKAERKRRKKEKRRQQQEEEEADRQRSRHRQDGERESSAPIIVEPSSSTLRKKRGTAPVAGPSRSNANGSSKGKAAAFAQAVQIGSSPRRAGSVATSASGHALRASGSGSGAGAGSAAKSGKSAAAPSRPDKGKGRAFSPRVAGGGGHGGARNEGGHTFPSLSPPPRRAAPPLSSSSSARKQTNGDDDAGPAPLVAEEIFSEEDKNLLVHHFARGVVKCLDPENVFLFLAQKNPQHTQASWRAYWDKHKSKLFGDMMAKAMQITQSQAAKEERLAAEREAQRRAEEAAEEAAEEERVAREAEELFRRAEEEEEERRAAQLEEKAAMQEAAVADLPPPSPVRPAAVPSADDHLFDAPSPSPPPPPRQAPARSAAFPSAATAEVPSQRRLASSVPAPTAAGAATPVKPSEVGAELAAAVLTPRHTPPVGVAQDEQIDESAEGLVAGDFDAGYPRAENAQPQHREDAAGIDLPSSQSSMPHHSQYSQMPSPFVRDSASLAAADAEGEEEVEMLYVDGVPKVEPGSDEDLELLVSRADTITIPVRASIDDDTDEAVFGVDGQMWNELVSAEQQVIQDLHAAVADIQQHLQQAGTRRRDAQNPAQRTSGSAGIASKPGRGLPSEKQAHEEAVASPGAATATSANVGSTTAPNQPTPPLAAVPNPAPAPAKTTGAATAPAAPTAYVLNSPPKKRQRERSPSSDLEIDDRSESQQAPAPKRKKLAPSPGGAAAEAPARPRHSAPAGLLGLQQDSPAPTPGRRVPRASLTAATQAGSASPAPPPTNPRQQPSAHSENRPPSDLTATDGAETRPQQAPTTSLPTGTSKNASQGVGPASNRGKSAATSGVKLKELIKSLARKYGVTSTAVTNLFFCISAKDDTALFEDLVRWIAPAHRPLIGTPEYERLAQLVAREVWTLREDTIALEGSEAAVAQLETKRGKEAIKRRVRFLGKANIKNVASLRKELYNF